MRVNRKKHISPKEGWGQVSARRSSIVSRFCDMWSLSWKPERVQTPILSFQDGVAQSFFCGLLNFAAVVLSLVELPGAKVFCFVNITVVWLFFKAVCLGYRRHQLQRTIYWFYWDADREHAWVHASLIEHHLCACLHFHL